MPEQPTHTFFNSRCAEYKTPFGAVPAGQTVTWRLTVPERLGYVDPHLVLTKDREDPVHYRMDFDGQTPGVNHFVFQLAPTTSGLYFYHFDLYTDFRKIYRTANGEGELTWVNGLDWQLTVYEPDFKTPDWIKDGTMYQIFPDRFYEGVPNKPLPFADRIYRPDKTGEPYFWPNEQSDGYLNMDYYGGDFAGIQQKLPYLEELGVTCIYLNPIFEAHANHRYNTANYLKADPLLGTNEDFAALCAEAKKHGIRIILDGVFSHTGSDSLYFNREGRYGPGGAYRDRNSPYRSWYDFDSGYVGGYRSWWGFETLPEVEEEDPSYGNFVCGKGGVIDTWLGLGASGFRLDVADELPDDFIERIRAAVKAHGEDKLLIGEVWEVRPPPHLPARPWAGCHHELPVPQCSCGFCPRRGCQRGGGADHVHLRKLSQTGAGLRNELPFHPRYRARYYRHCRRTRQWPRPLLAEQADDPWRPH